jgi:hypothetical protein
MNRLRAYFNWQLVRGIGQLHLLNRASMFLLAFVPILAAIWPTVRKVLEPALGHTTYLPASWAHLFAAALATMLGRTVFQLACPEVVKDFSLTDYVHSKKREYSDAPSLSAVNEAMLVLESSKAHEELIHEERETESEMAGQIRAIKEQLDQLGAERMELKNKQPERKSSVRVRSDDEGFSPKMYSSSDDDEFREQLRMLNSDSQRLHDRLRDLEAQDRGDRGPAFRRKMALVENAARHSYRQVAEKGLPSMLLCAAAYAIAIALILLVIWHQSKSIALAAGWLKNGW